MDSINTQPTPQTQNVIKGLIRLSRWKEQLPLATLTILGGLIAHGVYNTTLDWRLFAVAIANFLTVTFAFMINDMEDAEDDAASPVSAKRNPITNGTLALTTAWIACGVVVLVALGLFALGGLPVLIVGVFNLILSFLYSWKPVRLKSSTIGLDVVSHTLMLGGLLPLAGYLIYSTQPSTTIIFVVIATTLGSTYGQLYNQLRDFDADKKAGIMNVTIRVGKRTAHLLMYGAIVATIVCGFIAISQMSFPDWLPLLIAVAIAIGLAYSYFVHNDAGGKPAIDITGRLQTGFWLAFSLVMAIWVLWAMGVRLG